MVAVNVESSDADPALPRDGTDSAGFNGIGHFLVDVPFF
jgi:hypothetical protein